MYVCEYRLDKSAHYFHRISRISHPVNTKVYCFNNFLNKLQPKRTCTVSLISQYSGQSNIFVCAQLVTQFLAWAVGLRGIWSPAALQPNNAKKKKNNNKKNLAPTSWPKRQALHFNQVQSQKRKWPVSAHFTISGSSGRNSRNSSLKEIQRRQRLF